MTANDFLTAVGIALGALAIVGLAANLLMLAAQEQPAPPAPPDPAAPTPRQLEVKP